MKKIVSLILVLAMSFCLPTFASETEALFQSDTASTVEPKASHVFMSVTSAINKSNFGGSCSLVDDGKGTMTIRLQKYASASNSWVTMVGPSSKSFSGTDICSFGKSAILSKGKYRCRTDVTATVGNYTDSRTVYSGTLTIN